MSSYDTLILAINGCMASVSVGVNMWAMRADDPRRRPLRAMVAALSAVFALGYIWVLTTDNFVTYTRVFRGISVLTWPVVWCGPAILGAKFHQADKRALLDRTKDGTP